MQAQAGTVISVVEVNGLAIQLVLTYFSLVMFLRVQGAFTGVIQTIIKLCTTLVKRASKGRFFSEPVLHHHCRALAQRPLAELLNAHPHQNPTLSTEDLAKHL